MREAVEAGNFAANNFGLLLLTLARALVLPALLWMAWRTGQPGRAAAVNDGRR